MRRVEPSICGHSGLLLRGPQEDPGRPGAGPSPVPCPHAARLLAVLGPGHPPPLAGASAPQDTSGLRPQALGPEVCLPHPEDGLHSRLCLRGTRGGSNGLGGGSRDRVRCLERAGREPPHRATPCPRPVSAGGRGGARRDKPGLRPASVPLVSSQATLQAGPGLGRRTAGPDTAGPTPTGPGRPRLRWARPDTSPGPPCARAGRDAGPSHLRCEVFQNEPVCDSP